LLIFIGLDLISSAESAYRSAMGSMAVGWAEREEGESPSHMD
jgi:hypothetical protein